MRAKHNRKTGFQIGNLFFCCVQCKDIFLFMKTADAVCFGEYSPNPLRNPGSMSYEKLY